VPAGPPLPPTAAARLSALPPPARPAPVGPSQPGPQASYRQPYGGAYGGPAPTGGYRWDPPVAPPRPLPSPAPSGLFPTRTRPTYREAYPASGWAIAIGVLAGTVWMALLGVLASSGRAYVWWTVAAGVLGGLVAAALARLGDRGVAVGVALACAIGVAISFIVVTVRWVNGDWLLW
jgi:hypothetical protein